MYRALALKAMEQQVPLDDAEALRQLAQNSAMQLEPRGEGNRVLLDGRDVSQRIREADVTAAASRVSVHPQVRQVHGGAAARAGRQRRRSDGGPRHRHRRVSQRRGEGFSRRGRHACAPSGERCRTDRSRPRKPSASRPRLPHAMSAIAREPCRRWRLRRTRSSSILRIRASMKWWRRWKEL